MRMILIIFQKEFCLGQMTILGPKTVHPHGSLSGVRISLNFAQWKGPIGRWK